MVKASQDLLSTIITTLVPEKYWEGEGTVSFYQLLKQEQLDVFTKRHLGKVGCEAIKIDWDLLRHANLGMEIPSESFGIYISEEIRGVWKLAFVVLHEIGHIEQALSEDPRIRDFLGGKEAYADFYAVTELGRVLGFDKAVPILKKHSSRDGWEKIMELHKNGEL